MTCFISEEKWASQKKVKIQRPIDLTASSCFSSNLRLKQTTPQDWSVRGLASLSKNCNGLHVAENAVGEATRTTKTINFTDKFPQHFSFHVPAASVQIMSAVTLVG